MNQREILCGSPITRSDNSDGDGGGGGGGGGGGCVSEARGWARCS